MMTSASTPARTQQLFQQFLDDNHRRTSRIFAVLMVGQWLFAILLAALWSPYGWEGKQQSVHVHVWVAVLLGGAISSLPLLLTLTRPTATSTRMVATVAQMLWSALLIHLSGGRIETHFHIFGSLAFAAFYRDWRVLVPATVTVAADHLVRGLLWPESVYGIVNPEWWRFLEHAFWVAFEDAVLVFACIRGVEELHQLAERQATAEALSESERQKAAALAEANVELARSRDALKKLAEVGQLAASVGHELRNPLAAIRNGLAYVSKRVLDPAATPSALAGDERVRRFMGLMENELQVCSRIVADLLDFARERPPERRPCPLAPLVDEAVGLVPERPNVKIVNAVPAELPIPLLDREQFRQVLINLIQNAAEAIPPERGGKVTVSAEVYDGQAFRIRVADDGVGIPADVVPKVFQPLFTTKTKGTGLGLAIVAGMVQRHAGSISVQSEVGTGSTFQIELPGAAS